MKSHAKGSLFEREVCRSFSLWWSNNTNDAIFWRSDSSGARATVRTKQGKQTANSYGDMSSVDQSGFPFINRVLVEMKRGYNSSSIQDFVDRSPNSKKLPYEVFTDKLNQELKSSGRDFWMLVIKRDRREKIAFVNRAFFQFIREQMEARCKNWMFIRVIKDGYYYCFKLDDFFNCVAPSSFKEK